MPPWLRKVALTAHVATSVGWLGAVAAVLALAVAALSSEDVHTVRGAYLALELIGRFALVPLAVAALLTGIVQSLGTPWGLIRHYWVLFKLMITVVATVVLLLYMETLGYLATVAASASNGADQTLLQTPSVVIHAGGALVLLLVATVLAVFKPRGRTPFGLRQRPTGL